MIPEQAREKLERVARHISTSQRAIGEITNDLLAELTPQYHRFQVLAAVGEICGLSAGRINKIASVVRVFHNIDNEVAFGYYEAAYEFPEDDREAVLEFMDFYGEQYGRTPGVSELGFLYRQHIIGQDIAPHRQDETQKVIEDLIHALRRYIEITSDVEAEALLHRLSP